MRQTIKKHLSHAQSRAKLAFDCFGDIGDRAALCDARDINPITSDNNRLAYMLVCLLCLLCLTPCNSRPPLETGLFRGLSPMSPLIYF